MLDPDYLREITVGLENYWYDVETNILADIAERISLNKNNLTSTAEYQIMIARELGITNDRINKYLSEALDISSQEIEKIIKNSSYKAVESDNEIFSEAFKQGKIPKFNYDPESLRDLIDSGVAATTGELSNICKVTATTAQNKLLNILNSAYIQAESGAFSADFVVEQSVSKLAKEGLDWIDYKSGMHRRLDTVIRTAVRTATNQTAAKCQEMNMDELGCNLVEVTSHLGARPDHAVWQGKIYYRKEPYGNYSNFYDATGYGTVTGLCGANCRHSFYPYFPGISEKTFKNYSIKENSELYELEQQQRYNERHIREWKRRRDVKKAAGLDVSKENAKITYWNKRNKALIASDSRLKRNYGREKIYAKQNKNIPQMKIAKFGEEKTLKQYTPKEIIDFANKNEIIIDKYLSKESKWSGNIVFEENLDAKVLYGKLWSCDIKTIYETSPHLLLHEQLHARSVSYYDAKVYRNFAKMEESSVQFLAQEISEKEGIEIISSQYDELVDTLREINAKAGLYEKDFNFAKELFLQDLPERRDWLEDLIHDKMMERGDIDLMGMLNELILKFY